MKWIITIRMLVASTVSFAGIKNNGTELDHHNFSDSVQQRVTLASYVSANKQSNNPSYSLNELNFILQQKGPTQFSLGISRQRRKINAFYFPGTSNQRALVIGGVH